MHLTSMVWLTNPLRIFKSEAPTWAQLEVSCVECSSNLLLQLQNNLDYTDSAKERDYKKCGFFVSLPRVKFHPSCSTFVPNILLMILSFSLAHQVLSLRSWMLACWNLGETFCNLNLYLPWRAASTYQSTGGEFGMRWPTRPRCTGSEIPGLGWKNLTQELQIHVVSWGGDWFSKDSFLRVLEDMKQIRSRVIFNTLHVRAWDGRLKERLSWNGVKTELGLT